MTTQVGSLWISKSGCCGSSAFCACLIVLVVALAGMLVKHCRHSVFIERELQAQPLICSLFRNLSSFSSLDINTTSVPTCVGGERGGATSGRLRTGLHIYIRGGTRSNSVFQHKRPFPWIQLFEICWEFVLFILVPFTFSLAEWRLPHMFHFLIWTCVQAVIHLPCWEHIFCVMLTGLPKYIMRGTLSKSVFQLKPPLPSNHLYRAWFLFQGNCF